MFTTEMIQNLLHAQSNFFDVFNSKLKQDISNGYSDYMQHQTEDMQNSLFSFFSYCFQNPEKIQNAQANFLDGQKNILQDIFSNNKNDTQTQDKRFSHPSWNDQYFYQYIHASFLKFEKEIKSILCDIEEEQDTGYKTRFYVDQFLSALAPSNFPLTNPEIIEKTLKTQGDNFKHGLEKLKQTMESSSSFTSPFVLGKTIATAEGSVVFKNELIELIHYKPKNKKVYSKPLLIIPPWINKFYIFDLSPNKSLVHFLVQQGIDVYIISWLNPKNKEDNFSFEDYLSLGVISAENFILTYSNTEKINLLGYCLGGVLVSSYLAILGKKHEKIQSATLLATPLDFDKAGDLKIFSTRENLDFLTPIIEKTGFLDGQILSNCFSVLKSKEMIWNNLVQEYMLNEDMQPLDFLHWNNDITNLPEKMYRFYIENFYIKNGFMNKGATKLQKKIVHLSKIHTTTFWIAAKNDHIAPYLSTVSGIKLIPGEKEFLLCESGHVAGMFNPPSSQKYGFWFCDDYQKGSWWNAWLNWLKLQSGDLVEARYNQGLYPSPGQYVENEYKIQNES